MIPPCAREYHKDSGYTEAEKMLVFQGSCGPMGEADMETNNYRTSASSM